MQILLKLPYVKLWAIDRVMVGRPTMRAGILQLGSTKWHVIDDNL